MNKCQIGGKDTVLERNKESDLREGSVCSRCGRWACDECVDWGKSMKGKDDIVCKICAKE